MWFSLLVINKSRRWKMLLFGSRWPITQSFLFFYSFPFWPSFPPSPHLVTGVSRLDDQIFINRNPGVPSVVKFHPFNTCIAVADKDSIWSETRNTQENQPRSQLAYDWCDWHVTAWNVKLNFRFSSYCVCVFVVVFGTGRRVRGWTTSTTETLVTLASQPWSIWTDMTVRYCSLQQVWQVHTILFVYRNLEGSRYCAVSC